MVATLPALAQTGAMKHLPADKSSTSSLHNRNLLTRFYVY